MIIIISIIENRNKNEAVNEESKIGEKVCFDFGFYFYFVVFFVVRLHPRWLCCFLFVYVDKSVSVFYIFFCWC